MRNLAKVFAMNDPGSSDEWKKIVRDLDRDLLATFGKIAAAITFSIAILLLIAWELGAFDR